MLCDRNLLNIFSYISNIIYDIRLKLEMIKKRLFH